MPGGGRGGVGGVISRDAAKLYGYRTGVGLKLRGTFLTHCFLKSSVKYAQIISKPLAISFFSVIVSYNTTTESAQKGWQGQRRES
jgi:hypothetical protein